MVFSDSTEDSTKNKKSDNISKSSNMFDWEDEDEEIMDTDNKIMVIENNRRETILSSHKSCPITQESKMKIISPYSDKISSHTSEIKATFQGIFQKSMNFNIMKNVVNSEASLNEVIKSNTFSDTRSFSTKDLDLPKNCEASEWMQRIINNQPYTFYRFQSFQQKEQLLFAALSTCHTSCIIKVILFLRETLKHEIFKILLEKYPEASHEYNYFLKSLGQLESLKIVYSKPTLDQLLYDYKQIISRKLSIETIESLEKLYNKFQNYQMYKDYVSQIKKHIEILRLQFIRKEINNIQSDTEHKKSVINNVTGLCIDHLQQFPTFPKEYQKVFNLNDLQYEYIIIKSCCKLGLFQSLNRFYDEKKPQNIFKGSNPISSTTFDNICYLLRENGAPDDVIDKYINYISDKNLQMYTAENLNLHRSLLNIYINLRDKAKVKDLYLKTINNPETNKLVSDALSNQNIKWK